MKPVYFRQPIKLPVFKIFFLFLIALSACDTGSATTFSPVKYHPTPDNSPSVKYHPTPDNSVPSNTDFTFNSENINIQAGNLLIQSAGGIQCPNKLTNPAGVNPFVKPDKQLVLASNRTIYNQTEITQIRSYLTDYYQGKEDAKLPSTLREMPGGVTNPTTDFPLGTGCGAALMLTNTGNTPIQIPKVAIQVKAPPQENTYQYRLIDTCTLGFCPGGTSGGNDCSIYFASIQLGLGDIFSAVPRGPNASCGTLTIAPSAQIYLDLTFSPATNVPQNLIYSISPIFTLDTAQGEQMLSPPQLISTLAFANNKQFSCYGWQGTSFVLVPSPKPQENYCA